MIRKISFLTPFISCIILSGCITGTENPYSLADPMTGTGFHGHTFPGATTPFGMVQLSPDTRFGDWDACSGYHYSDSTLDGFSHTHLSGTGCGDLGDIFVRPTSAAIDLEASKLYTPSKFSHDTELTRPGYYYVELLDENIDAELTATTHTGVHRYTFPENGNANIIFDLDHLITEENIREAKISPVSDIAIEGMRITDGWVPDQHVYFYAEFSRPFEASHLAHDGHALILEFENNGKPVEIAVGLSGVSTENAKENLKREVPSVNFDEVEKKVSNNWAEALDIIKVEGGTLQDRKNFYSALYHTMVTPNTMNDVNGQFRRNDGSVTTLDADKNHYSTLSLWDTYRTWHPLMTILNPDLVCDIVNSMLDMYDATGTLPIWPLASGETECMIGYHSVSVICDAYMKGLKCFDPEKALAAMVASTKTDRKGADVYAKTGYIPSDSYRESVSCALEYGYDDWCIARMAEALGNDSIAKIYYNRAANYTNIFDGSTKFFRGRRSDGNMEFPFDPYAVNRDLTEATSWQYRFAPVHDINGLINIYGGKDSFVNALDSIFSTTSEINGDQSDISGMIGQYAQGNEPSHHVAYLYNYVGQPWKTQNLTRQILKDMYQPTPEGICGNEDCGQMSAWFIMSSLGFYPVVPGSNEYTLTTPLFSRATISLPDNKTLDIVANNPEKNTYIKSIKLNGKEIEDNFITHSQIMEGGTLEFTLTDSPFTERGNGSSNLYSMTTEEIVSPPFLDRDLYLFTDSITFSLGSATPGAEIHYTLDGSEPSELSPLYTTPITLDKTTTVKAKAYKKDMKPSSVVTVIATEALYSPAVTALAAGNGLKYNYYEGLCSKTSDIVKGELKKTGIINRPSLSEALQEDHFAFIFEGMIDVPKAGIYTFRTTSDDGSVLFIDGKPVVNNDGGHSAVPATGLIPLYKGKHNFKLLYFEDYEGESLDVDWKIPGNSDFTPIPDSSFYHK